jgi:hypothetical protein
MNRFYRVSLPRTLSDIDRSTMTNDSRLPALYSARFKTYEM